MGGRARAIRTVYAPVVAGMRREMNKKCERREKTALQIHGMRRAGGKCRVGWFFRCTEPLFFSIIRRWKPTRALRPKEGISYEQELCRRRAARFAGASRARVGARCALVLLATAVFAVFAYHARYAKIDEFTGFRAEELIRFTTVAGRALCAHGSGGAAHRQKAEFLARRRCSAW